MAARSDIERRHIDWPVNAGDSCPWPATNMPDDRDADALLEWIEDCDVPARFVPDWSDESIRNAA
jgi:hypothetical protein